MASDDIDKWIEGLLEDLKIASTGNWASEHRAFPAMPAKIEGAIIKRSAGIDPKVLRVYYEQAIIDFGKSVQENDPHAETLQRASARLSELLKSL
jgi:hypothetical protein